MTPEELSDHTHNGMMNHALSSVAAIFEGDGWSTCDALKAANGLLEPAFRAWGELMERIIADDKRIRELEAQLVDARLDSARLDWLQEWMKFGRNDLLTRYRVFDGKVYANLIHPDDAMGAKAIPGQDNIRAAIDAEMKEAK